MNKTFGAAIKFNSIYSLDELEQKPTQELFSTFYSSFVKLYFAYFVFALKMLPKTKVLDLNFNFFNKFGLNVYGHAIKIISETEIFDSAYNIVFSLVDYFAAGIFSFISHTKTLLLIQSELILSQVVVLLEYKQLPYIAAAHDAVSVDKFENFCIIYPDPNTPVLKGDLYLTINRFGTLEAPIAFNLLEHFGKNTIVKFFTEELTNNTRIILTIHLNIKSENTHPFQFPLFF